MTSATDHTAGLSYRAPIRFKASPMKSPRAVCLIGETFDAPSLCVPLIYLRFLISVGAKPIPNESEKVWPDQLGHVGILRREVLTVFTPDRDEANAKPGAVRMDASPIDICNRRGCVP